METKTFGTLHAIRTILGDKEILNEFSNWLSSGLIDEFNEFLIKNHDLDYFYPETFGGGDED